MFLYKVNFKNCVVTGINGINKKLLKISATRNQIKPVVIVSNIPTFIITGKRYD